MGLFVHTTSFGDLGACATGPSCFISSTVLFFILFLFACLLLHVCLMCVGTCVCRSDSVTLIVTFCLYMVSGDKLGLLGKHFIC